jgi:hypothetical protein
MRCAQVSSRSVTGFCEQGDEPFSLKLINYEAFIQDILPYMRLEFLTVKMSTLDLWV